MVGYFASGFSSITDFEKVKGNAHFLHFIWCKVQFSHPESFAGGCFAIIVYSSLSSPHIQVCFWTILHLLVSYSVMTTVLLLLCLLWRYQCQPKGQSDDQMSWKWRVRLTGLYSVSLDSMAVRSEAPSDTGLGLRVRGQTDDLPVTLWNAPNVLPPITMLPWRLKKNLAYCPRLRTDLGQPSILNEQYKEGASRRKINMLKSHFQVLSSSSGKC